VLSLPDWVAHVACAVVTDKMKAVHKKWLKDNEEKEDETAGSDDEEEEDKVAKEASMEAEDAEKKATLFDNATAEKKAMGESLIDLYNKVANCLEKIAEEEVGHIQMAEKVFGLVVQGTV
jgi:hypothetical protein